MPNRIGIEKKLCFDDTGRERSSASSNTLANSRGLVRSCEQIKYEIVGLYCVSFSFDVSAANYQVASTFDMIKFQGGSAVC